MIDLLVPLAGDFRRPILDVGCSHGYGVERLWRSNLDAVGVDVAPTAIAMANAHRTRGRRCGGLPCYQVASATRLPFANKSVDAILSTDVLEHLLPSELDAMATEFLRVARRMLFLKVAPVAEKNLGPIWNLHKARQFPNVTQLHTTIMPIVEWQQLFVRHGASRVSRVSTSSKRYGAALSNDTLVVLV